MTDSLKFGTSGLRGLVVDLAGQASREWTAAFLAYVAKSRPDASRLVYVGRDLRSSSPSIAADCLEAARIADWRAVDYGELPTPALALAALDASVSAIMVTGSHIPDDRNGLKFYVLGHEITKDDETGIVAQVGHAPGAGISDQPPIETFDGGLEGYIRRYLDFFSSNSLSGLTVGLYEQSSVARDALRSVLEGLGAQVLPFARSKAFIPVDTEAHRPEDILLLREFAAANRVDAIISADGDADRPLLTDATGTVVRGDLLGLLTAEYLGLRTIVTPLTSSSAAEMSGVGRKILRTKVGSPFVIAAMKEAIDQGGTDVIGFEANGGVLQASPVERDGRVLAALPTRDAMLPIISALALARARGETIAETVRSLGAGHALADRLKEIPSDRSGPLLRQLASDDGFAAAFMAEAGPIASVNGLDGVRFVLQDGSTVHFRASGNAPEFRCYVEAASEQRAGWLLNWGLAKAKTALA